MKATFYRRLRRLLGVSSAPAEGSVSAVPLRLSRLPFLVTHVVAYAFLYLITACIGYLYAKAGQQFTLGEFEVTLSIFVLSLILLPVYVRRAHDLGWSFKYVLYFLLIPAFVRLLLLLIPLIVLLSQSLLNSILQIMPAIGLIYWTLGKVQLIFAVVLAFAPSTGTHNSYGEVVGHTFTTRDMYGFSLFKSSKNKK